MALERINAIQSGNTEKRKRETESLPGCRWFVADAEHNYCFWHKINGDIDASTDKEICDTLLLSSAQVEKALANGLSKLRENKNSEDIQAFKEAAQEVAEKNNSPTLFLPNAVQNSINKISTVPEGEEDRYAKKFRKRKKSAGMSVHRDGKKVQLYGLYSKPKLDKMRKEDNASKNKKDKDKEK